MIYIYIYGAVCVTIANGALSSVVLRVVLCFLCLVSL